MNDVEKALERFRLLLEHPRELHYDPVERVSPGLAAALSGQVPLGYRRTVAGWVSPEQWLTMNPSRDPGDEQPSFTSGESDEALRQRLRYLTGSEIPSWVIGPELDAIAERYNLKRRK